jgi:hypothetical protein
MKTGTVIFIALLITLAVLGHTVWHAAGIMVMNVIAQVFTGAHVA